jgi:O-antigen/teichoic acid export membrane protein
MGLPSQETIQAIWAILDQAAVSLANFALNFALARYAAPQVYGIFIIVFTLLLLAYSCVQAPLTLDPLIMLGGKKGNKEAQFVYARRVLALNLLISLVSIMVLIAAGVSLGVLAKGVYARATLLASIPLIFLNLRFFIRCFYIMRGEFIKAFVNDVNVLVVVSLGIVNLIYWGMTNDWTIIILLTVGEATASFLLITTMRKQTREVISGLVSDIKAQPMPWRWSEARQNWDYGKWLLLANGALYAYQNAQFLLLPIFVPLASLAGYRAAYLLAQPIYLFAAGLEAFARNKGIARIQARGIWGLQDFMLKMSLIVSVFIVLYMMFIGFNSRLALESVFAGKFGEFSELVWFFAFASLFSFWGMMLGIGFRVLEATSVLFLSTLFTGAIGLATFIVLASSLGVKGAAMSYTGASLLSVFFLSVYWLKKQAYIRL